MPRCAPIGAPGSRGVPPAAARRIGAGLAALALFATPPARAAPSRCAAGPAVPEALREQVRRYANSRGAAFLDATTDGAQLLIGARFGEARQLHLVDAPLGMREELTFSERPIEDARFLPQDPNVVVYLQDPTGEAGAQLFTLDRRRARSVQVTGGTGRASDLLLSRDGRRLAWASWARDGSGSEVWVAESDAPAASRRLTALPGRWRPVDFSPNGRGLLVVREKGPGDAELFLAPVDGGAPKKLWPSAGDGQASSVRTARFSADGHELFLVTDRFAGAEELVRVDPDHPEEPARRLTEGLRWDVDALAVAEDRGAPAAGAIAVDQGGYDRLYLLEPGTLELMPVSLPPGVVTALRFPTARSDVLFLGLSTPTRPEDVYQLDVRTRRLTRWTRSELGPLDASLLLEPARVGWTSGGAAVPALLYLPRGEAGAKSPVLLALDLEASPRALSRPRFDALAQLLAGELGIAVLEPDLRGARSEGERLRDLSAGLDWLAAQPELDPARVALRLDPRDAAAPEALALARDLEAPPAAPPNLANRLRAVLGAAARAPDGTRCAEEATLEELLVQLNAQLLAPPASAMAPLHPLTPPATVRRLTPPDAASGGLWYPPRLTP